MDTSDGGQVAVDLYCPPILSHYGVVECCKNISDRIDAAHQALIRYSGDPTIKQEDVENPTHIFEYVSNVITSKLKENEEKHAAVTTDGLYRNRDLCLTALAEYFTPDLIRVASPWHEWCVETVRFVDSVKHKPLLYDNDKIAAIAEAVSDQQQSKDLRTFVGNALNNVKSIEQFYSFLNEIPIALDATLPLVTWYTTATAISVLKEVVLALSNLVTAGYAGTMPTRDSIRSGFESLRLDDDKPTAEILVEMALLISSLFSVAMYSDVKIFTLAPNVQLILLWFTVQNTTSIIALECTPSSIYDLRRKRSDPLLTDKITNAISQLASLVLPVDASTLDKLY